MTEYYFPKKLAQAEFYLWCKSHGIKARELTQGNSDDLALLMQFKEEFITELNRSDRGTFDGIWGMVKQGYLLKSKHLAKLEFMASKVLERREKQLTAKAKIKSLRS